MQTRLHQLWCISILAFFSSLAVTAPVQWPQELENISTTFDHDTFSSSRLSRRTLWQLEKKGQFQFISNNQLGPPPKALPYMADNSGGKDVAIFIIDAGFAGYKNSPELLPDRRTVTYYKVPEDKYPSLYPGWSYQDQIRETHGLDCAVAAGGKQSGISPNSDLVLIEVGRYIESGNDIRYMVTDSVLKNGFNYILDHMSERSKRGYRKAVVSISVGFGREFNSQEVDKEETALWTKFLHELDERGVAVFAAPGNGGLEGQTTAAHYPAYLGKPDNNLITVGGVYPDGTFWPNTTRESPEGGSISLFAPVTHLVGTHMGKDYVKDFTGQTSVGTAIAAGQGAYFLGIDPIFHSTAMKDMEKTYGKNEAYLKYLPAVKAYSKLGKELYENGVPVAMKLKRYMTEKASFQRSTQILAHYPIKKAGKFLPTRLNAIYNMGRGPPPAEYLDCVVM